MPMEWLQYTWRLHKLNETGPRKGGPTDRRKRVELEKETSAYLLSPKEIKTVLEGLEPDEKQLLDYLTERGGASSGGPVVRKFGSMKKDSFYLKEGNPPISTIGRLWSKGLVMVGRGLYKGKRQRVVLIPQDLLPLL